MKDDSYVVYVLSCSDGSLYTGVARDLEKRLEAHRAGTGSKYVRARLPVVLAYQEKSANRSQAQSREAEIKSWTRAEKLTRLGIDPA